MGGRRRSFTPLSDGWEDVVIHSEEEVIHFIELWVGGGGHSLRGGGNYYPKILVTFVVGVKIWIGT